MRSSVLYPFVMVPGTLFTNKGCVLFSFISLIDDDDTVLVWRWGFRHHEDDFADGEDDTRPRLFSIEGFASWTRTYPPKVLWAPDVHRSDR